MRKVQLIYFRKETGKYCASFEYMTPLEHMWEIFEDAIRRRSLGVLPGIIHEALPYYHILVDCPEHPLNYPHLILAGN